MKLLPESEEDSRMASLLKLIPSNKPDEKREKIETESIFEKGKPSQSFGSKLQNLHKAISTQNGGSTPFSSSR